MNLKKLFNFKFLKENIKKSKAILLFIVVFVPIITTVYLFVQLMNDDVIVFFEDLSMITYLGLFIIPIIIAYTLFGFVFKRKNVDFVMSKPISRKKMYWTNILGGIGLISLLFLIIGLLFGLFGIFSSLVIPFGLIIDYILYWLVAYIFVFLVASLAISLAGNLVTTIIIILLALFLYPTVNIINNNFKSNYQDVYISLGSEYKITNYVCLDEECEKHLNNDEYDFHLSNVNKGIFTAPRSYIENPSYDNKVIIKEIVLIIILLPLGLWAFSKRKMEDCEMSFKSHKVYLGVKILTFIPISFFAYILCSSNMANIPLAIILCLSYYFVYDVIVKRELKRPFRILLSFLINLVIMFGIYSLITIIYNSNDVVLNDLSSITFNYNKYDTIEIKDKELIKKMIQINSNSNDIEKHSVTEIIIKNKALEYSLLINMNDEIITLVDNYIVKENIKSIYEKYDYEKLVFVGDYNMMEIPITRELKELINEYKSEYPNTSFKGYNDINVKLFNYKNHKYNLVDLNVVDYPKFKDYVVKFLNNKFYEEFKKSSYFQLGVNDNTYFSEKEIFVADYVLNHNKEILEKFVADNKDQVFEKEFISIRGNGMIFYIKDIEAFRGVWDKMVDKVKNDTEYQDYLKMYNEYKY